LFASLALPKTSSFSNPSQARGTSSQTTTSTMQFTTLTILATALSLVAAQTSTTSMWLQALLFALLNRKTESFHGRVDNRQ
jgi:hypothetical protein